MKTKLYLILTIVALFVCACAEDHISNGFEPDDLSGKVVFQKVSTRTLKMADVNSMYQSASYDYILTYTRPVWSQDGSKFAAIELKSSVETGTGVSVFAIKIVDAESEGITSWEIGPSTKIEVDEPLTWSPDGSTIAFMAHPYNRIIYLDIQTGDTIHTEFAEKISGGITSMAWHPDGDIAVDLTNWHDYQRDHEVWMLEPYTTTLKNKISASVLTTTSGFTYMDWNPEGSKLLLSPSSYSHELYVLDVSTGGFTQIPEIYGLALSWSQDGKYILYTGIAGHSGLNLIPGLFVSDTEGSFEKQLISDAGYSDWY